MEEKTYSDYKLAFLDHNVNITGKLCLEISCSQNTFFTFSDVYINIPNEETNMSIMLHSFALPQH